MDSSEDTQEMTRMLASERQRLAEMVELAPFCMMVMNGPALVIVAVNPTAGRVLAGGEDVKERPFDGAFSRDGWLVEGVRAAYRDDTTWTSGPRPIATPDGAAGDGGKRTFIFTAVPAHEDGKVDGVVLYGVDVTGWPEHA